MRARRSGEVRGEHAVAEVAYDLTALDPAAGEDLERFAAAFDDMLGEWERLIGAAIA